MKIKTLFLGLLFSTIVFLGVKNESFAFDYPDNWYAGAVQAVNNAMASYDYYFLTAARVPTSSHPNYYESLPLVLPENFRIGVYLGTVTEKSRLFVTTQAPLAPEYFSTVYFNVGGVQDSEHPFTVVNLDALYRSVYNRELRYYRDYWNSSSGTLSFANNYAVGVGTIQVTDTSWMPALLVNRSANISEEIYYTRDYVELWEYLYDFPPEVNSDLILSKPTINGVFNGLVNVYYVGCDSNSPVSRVVCTMKCGSDSETIEMVGVPSLGKMRWTGILNFNEDLPNASRGDLVYIYLTGYDADGNYSNSLYTSLVYGRYFSSEWKEAVSGSFGNNLNVPGLTDVTVGVTNTTFYNYTLNPEEYIFNIDNSSKTTIYYQVYDVSNETNMTELNNYVVNNYYNISGDTTYIYNYNTKVDYTDYQQPDGYYQSPSDYLNDLNSSKDYVFDTQSQSMELVTLGDNIQFFKPILIALGSAIGVLLVAFIVSLIIKAIDIIWP